MKEIKAIKHYAIPEKCKHLNTCPFESEMGTSIPKTWEPKYTELILEDSHLLRNEQTGAYTPQGGCTDGAYIYRALVEHDDQPAKIQKLDMFGNVVIEKVTDSLGHANDMCYCAKDDYLYVLHSSSTSIVYKVDPATLNLVDTINIGPAVWGIAYNEVDDVFLLGNVGAAYLSVYTYTFDFMYRIKPDNPFSAMVRQGISCDDNYIYVALDHVYGATTDDKGGSRIAVYTWNGMFIKSIYLDIKEIEFVEVLGNRFIIGTYEGRDENDVKSGKLYLVDFDLYPGQTVLTGRPTDVSGGFNNLQRLPEGTPVRLWKGQASGGDIVLQIPQKMGVDEDGPFRTIKFYFKGANQNIFEWKMMNTGTVALRETDITEAVSDTTVRIREARLTYNKSNKTFTFGSNQIQQIFHDASEDKITFTKDTVGDLASLIEISEIWGIV